MPLTREAKREYMCLYMRRRLAVGASGQLSRRPVRLAR